MTKRHMRKILFPDFQGNTNQDGNEVSPLIGEKSLYIKGQKSQCWRGSGEKGTHYWWEFKLVKTPWKTIWSSLKIFTVPLSLSSRFIFNILKERGFSKYSKWKSLMTQQFYLFENIRTPIWRQTHIYIHCTAIDNSQDMVAIEMQTNRWVEIKHDSYRWNITQLQKGQDSAFCNSVNETGRIRLSENSRK